MENKVTVFENNEFGKVRTLVIDGEPWFVGKDIAEILGYAKARNAIATHVDDEDKKGAPIQGDLGGTQEMTIINESGVYSLILSSKLPTAKRFKHWVTSDVLPSIRKNGSYNLPHDYLSALKALVAAEEERQKLLAENTEMKPKADFYDDVTASSDIFDIKQVAKLLNVPNMGRNKLFAFLREKRVLNHKNEPYQCYVDRGYFRQVESSWDHEGTTHIRLKTVVFQKGVDYIRKLLKKNQAA